MRLRRSTKPLMLDGQEQMSMRHKELIINPMLIDDGLVAISIPRSSRKPFKKISRLQARLAAWRLVFKKSF